MVVETNFVEVALLTLWAVGVSVGAYGLMRLRTTGAALLLVVALVFPVVGSLAAILAHTLRRPSQRRGDAAS